MRRFAAAVLLVSSLVAPPEPAPALTTANFQNQVATGRVTDTGRAQVRDSAPVRDTAALRRADTIGATASATTPADDAVARMLPIYLAMLVFGLAIVAIGIGFLNAMEGDGQVSAESHWGGFGGGGGGWRLSRPLSYLIALVFFAGMLAALALSSSGRVAEKTTAQSTTPSTGPATQSGSTSQPAQTTPPTPPAMPGGSRQ